MKNDEAFISVDHSFHQKSMKVIRSKSEWDDASNGRIGKAKMKDKKVERDKWEEWEEVMKYSL
ncbi:hypothetical protein HPP92_024742 [Vanilla planifolia]|uniref:Uncharacterized protein n=1 Tax=Vanilla planifolia TaxID=51239 RepID=A0A835PK83_VANPL|nr:hypothetical protein HPP92_024742 [Vanilla planifolia]